MFETIADLYPRDPDFPERTHRLLMMRRVLEGKLYDGLPYQFFQNMTDAGEPISLSQRKPSVRYNLCRLVVMDSTSMLFSDMHFPAIDSQDRNTRERLLDVIKESRLVGIMTDVALNGAIGSACVLMRVLDGRLFFDRFDTAYLTPEWKPNAPDTLLRVTEKYKVRGDVLKAQGYRINEKNLMVNHWFMRQWTENQEIWFVPWTKEEEVKESFQPKVDEERTVTHGLGFVPMVWIRNLSGGDKIDGACTFDQAIHTAIEIDYQLSQAGRGLKYSSDPELLLKEPANEDGQILKGSGNAIVVSEKGDARWLEIRGDAVGAVLDYARFLRELAIESIRGNRASADRLTAAQSGKALELLHQSLIWLTGELRTSYGEEGLLPLLRMVIAASEKIDITCMAKPLTGLQSEGLHLRWPAFFSPTEQDKVQQSEALRNLRDFGNISRESAVKTLSAAYDIENVGEEMARIEADERAEMERQIELHAQTQLKEVARAGPI